MVDINRKALARKLYECFILKKTRDILEASVKERGRRKSAREKPGIQ
jgi:hypothetical protein